METAYLVQNLRKPDSNYQRKNVYLATKTLTIVKTTSDVDSKAYRVLEAVTLAPLVIPFFLGVAVFVGGMAFVGGWNDRTIGRFVALYESSILLYLVAIGIVPALLVVGTLASIHFDSQRVRSADVGWDPSSDRVLRWGLFLLPVVGIYYLYKRHQYVEDQAGRGWWSWVAAASGVVPILLYSTAAVSAWTEHWTLVVLCLGAGLVVSTLFPVAIYQDATYVRRNSAGWKPNPAVYLGVALLSVFLLFFPVPFVGGYYLYCRHRVG